MDGPESSTAEETLADCWAKAEEGVMISPVPVCSPTLWQPVTVSQKFPQSRFPSAVAVTLTRHHTRLVVDQVWRCGCPP